MTMTMNAEPKGLAYEVDTDNERVDVSAVAVLNRSEVECQLSAAHRYPRSLARFLQTATEMATMSQGTAETCVYAVRRGDDFVRGPSVRLAEICASAYGNLHLGSRVVAVEDNDIVAQGIAWDLQANVRVTVEVRRRITNKHGKRYSDDMIQVTGAAAVSIALRNAIFRVVPRAYVNVVYDRARAVAVGDAKTLIARRNEILDRMQKLGVTPERIVARLGKARDDIGLEELELLIGLGTSIKDGSITIDDAFPAAMAAPAPPAEDGKRISMKGTKAKADTAEPAPKAATKDEPYDPTTGEIITQPAREPGEEP